MGEKILTLVGTLLGGVCKRPAETKVRQIISHLCTKNKRTVAAGQADGRGREGRGRGRGVQKREKRGNVGMPALLSFDLFLGSGESEKRSRRCRRRDVAYVTPFVSSYQIQEAEISGIWAMVRASGNAATIQYCILATLHTLLSKMPNFYHMRQWSMLVSKPNFRKRL